MMLRKIVSLGVEMDQIKATLAQKTAADENASRIGTLSKNFENLTKTLEEMKKVQDDLCSEIKRKQNRSSAVAIGDKILKQQEMLQKKREQRVEQIPSSLAVSHHYDIDMKEVEEKIDDSVQQVHDQVKQVGDQLAEKIMQLQKRQDEEDARRSNIDKLIRDINDQLFD